MKRRPFLPYISFLALLCAGPSLYAQEILTASHYFDQISENYAHISDYVAHLTITQKAGAMRGTLYYKKPDLMRIDFSDPANQVIVTNGKVLTIYIPSESAVFQQTLAKGSGGTGANLATSEGLQLLRKNYSIAYLESPKPVPLDAGSSEKVVKLKLEWRTTEEGFRQLELDIGTNGLIRRIIGVTPTYERIQFDFTDIQTNQNIPDGRFRYHPPETANTYPNFLFVPES